MPTLTGLVAPPERPGRRPYRILWERRPHLSLVSAPSSWRSQRTEEQCTWSSFPARHTSSTVCGEKGQCHHHLTLCLLSTPPTGCVQVIENNSCCRRFTFFCIEELKLVLADSLSLSVWARVQVAAPSTESLADRAPRGAVLLREW